MTSIRTCKVIILPGRLLLLLLLSLCFAGCGGGAGGDVVKVRDVEVVKNSIYTGLKRDDVEKLQELKKSIIVQKDDENSDVVSILGKTPNYTVPEYLEKYPESATLGEDYKIGGYDILSITVYEEKDLTIESIRVSADGYISFPLIGRVHVADMTTSEVEKEISTKLSEGSFLLDAHVSVMVTKYEGRKYSVLGAVKSPGNYPLQAREKLLDGLSKAGGLDDGGGSSAGWEPQEAMIIRALDSGKTNQRKIVINVDLQGLLKGKDQLSNIYLADNDVLYIPKANFFYIIGEVKNPGSYPFVKKDITIVEALSIAGGFTRIAARNKTRIIRIENGAERIYDVNVDEITKAGKMIQAIPIKPNDLIVVPESFF